MWKMGANDWIKYGWGSDLAHTWFPSASLILDFTNNLTPISQVPPLTAATELVQYIIDNYPSPYTLMCSGGIDSQAMLWAWYKHGHQFNIVSVKYITKGVWFNKLDLETLTLFCNTYNLPITFKEFDVVKFLESSELKNVSTRYDCHSPQICTHIKMSEMVTNGTILFSGNYLSDLFRSLNYTILGMHRYSLLAQTHARKIIPYFLLGTPELAYSFKRDAFGKLCCDTGYNSKIDAYTDNHFPVIAQQQKFTGFEEIKKYYRNYPNLLTARQKLVNKNRDSREVFDVLFRYGLEDDRRVDTSNVHAIMLR